jgi:hypothetical protein
MKSLGVGRDRLGNDSWGSSLGLMSLQRKNTETEEINLSLPLSLYLSLSLFLSLSLSLCVCVYVCVCLPFLSLLLPLSLSLFPSGMGFALRKALWGCNLDKVYHQELNYPASKALRNKIPASKAVKNYLFFSSPNLWYSVTAPKLIKIVWDAPNLQSAN